MARVAGAITVALLSALTVMNTFASGTALVLDARLAAMAAAALALWLRLPFLPVVVLGAGRWGFSWGVLGGCCQREADLRDWQVSFQGLIGPFLGQFSNIGRRNRWRPIRQP